MKPLTRSKSATLALLSITGVLAFGAANAYAAENVLTYDDGQSRAWTFTKTAVTDTAALATSSPAVVRNVEELPDLIVPLNTDMRMQPISARDLSGERTYSAGTDLRELDLVEDSPVFIGSQGVSEFDTIDAQRERAAYPNSLGVDPLTPVAGAGLATPF